MHAHKGVKTCLRIHRAADGVLRASFQALIGGGLVVRPARVLD